MVYVLYDSLHVHFVTRCHSQFWPFLYWYSKFLWSYLSQLSSRGENLLLKQREKGRERDLCRKLNKNYEKWVRLIKKKYCFSLFMRPAHCWFRYDVLLTFRVIQMCLGFQLFPHFFFSFLCHFCFFLIKHTRINRRHLDTVYTQ